MEQTADVAVAEPGNVAQLGRAGVNLHSETVVGVVRFRAECQAGAWGEGWQDGCVGVVAEAGNRKVVHQDFAHGRGRRSGDLSCRQNGAGDQGGLHQETEEGPARIIAQFILHAAIVADGECQIRALA